MELGKGTANVSKRREIEGTQGFWMVLDFFYNAGSMSTEERAVCFGQQEGSLAL
jgi:hypothetical protein